MFNVQIDKSILKMFPKDKSHNSQRLTLPFRSQSAWSDSQMAGTQERVQSGLVLL